MGSLSRRYQQSLRHHCQFLRSCCRSLRHCRDPWGDRRTVATRLPLQQCWTLLNSLNIVKQDETLVKHCDASWNIVKQREPLVKHHEPLIKHHEILKTLWNIMKQLPIDAETLALGVAISVLACSFWQYRPGVSGNIGVGIIPQMCNRVTNHGDMGTFSRPDRRCVIDHSAVVLNQSFNGQAQLPWRSSPPLRVQSLDKFFVNVQCLSNCTDV